MSARTRTWLTGDTDWLPDQRERLALHPELEVLADASPARADVVLLATDEPVVPLARVAALREHTTAPIVLLASTPSSALADEAAAAGLADVLVMPQPPENVAFAVRKVRGGAAQTGEPRRQARIVAVFSPKGGTGKSVTATNLAVAFADRQRLRTLLLDLDLQFGDTAIMLGLEPRKTLYDLVTAPGDLDADKLDAYTTEHRSGVHLLPAPLRPEDADLVNETKVRRLLEVAVAAYDAIVVDTSPCFHAAMLAMLDRTDELLLITAPDVPTLKNVRLTLHTLELLGFPSDRIRIVLNRATERVGLRAGEIGAVLGRRVDADLPTDAIVPIAVNRGEPAVLFNPDTPYAHALFALAAEVAGAPTPKRPRLARALAGLR